MNKAQLVEAIADKVGGRQNAAEAVDAVLDAMVRAVVAGERVSVTGFGSFEKVDRPARYARNPQTGERVRVKKTSVPRFRAGQGFKDLVSGTKKLPKNDVAVKKAPKGSLTGGTKTTAKAAAKKATAKKASAAKKTTATAKKATPAKKTTATAKKTSAAAKKTTATAKKATPAKSTAKKATAKKTAPAKKATATKAPAKKSSARKTTAKKTTATARKK
ncbi:HU family DNA-binding protein [Streptomyces albidoflavus]|uniref:HU family DNA-binding protein n=3 Tax=Streptomyces TaxID=1883 RepID=A0ABY3H405_9ACTN|nr:MULTISPECIES: HU family DNA-binding protein [Streptomyces]MBO1288072.1 HU family DNA-binding protein [Streptomyces sampsonii]MYQ73429.1 DNA-binding protein [Streptomyces sp. SID4934]MYW57356.1 DNA-binding protein [Streptomyces sp. SID8370]MYW86238.1 DNA-binding protein [Streptomyces sp. SID8371]MYX53043.1 DNA-binding protein [Streptomyces sp. SID8385]NUW08932.1 HU family DNA-binding protein [Streptomyces sp. CAI-21]NVI29482.1 HU family DNA-binding protein [Streptomyces sp. CAI-17]SCD5144